MHARTRSSFALAILLSCCACAFALDPSLDISQYAQTTWKVRNGFTNGAIYSIAQTPDGYLWLGTELGLVRFDGVRPIPWQAPQNQHLPSSPIRRLLVARDGTLWIGGKGLASWKNGKLIEYPELAGQYIFGLVQDHDGIVWVGAAGIPFGRLCAVREGRFHCNGEDGFFGRAVFGLYEDSKGTLWAGVKDGLWRWKPGPPKFYSLPNEPDGIHAIGEDVDGGLLVGWRGGIYRVVDGEIERYSVPGTSRKFGAQRILLDRNGGLWIGTSDQGLVHIHQGRTDVFSPTDGLSGNNVFALFEDREGDVWVSTIEGIDRFRDFAVATLTMKQGLSNARVGSVLADKDGSVWLGTDNGLNRWDHGQLAIPPTGSAKRDGKLNGSLPSSLFQDDVGRLWVSTLRELGYLRDGRFTVVRGVPGGTVLSLAQDNEHNLWVINEHVGLFRISREEDLRQIPWSSFGRKDHASVLAADRHRGGLWIGFFLGGIVHFSDGRVRATYTTADGLGSGHVSDFEFDHSGALWVSTEGGLSRLKNNRIATLTSKNGLPCDTVHWTIEDDDHSLWLYMACGLVRIASSELRAWAGDIDRGQDSGVSIRVTVFASDDGVRNSSGPDYYHPQVAKSSDGRLWFLPFDGVSVIDPRHMPFNKIPPAVHIEKITADDKTVDVSNGMHLPSGVRHLDIDYTALSLVVPEKVRFRIKLEGEDKDWRELVNVRHVEYTNLPPKHYTFRVLACNNSGVWNEQGATLDFVIPPAWYQTNWFRSLCVAVFLALLWMLHQLRLRQQARQFNMTLEARVGERTRIARELHDTLLQSFHGLLLQFRAASQLVQPHSQAKQILDTAIERAADAIAESRKTVQGLRTSTVEGRDLGLAIRTVGEELAAANAGGEAIGFQVQGVGPRRDLRALMYDEVYRIAVEALRNSFQHAGAKRITVEIHYDPREFRLRISDDGRGIDAELLQGEGLTGHFGLPGMRERAKIIGGKLAVWSSIGEGTEVDLRIPGAKAYSGANGGPWWSGKLSRKEKEQGSTAGKGM